MVTGSRQYRVRTEAIRERVIECDIKQRDFRICKELLAGQRPDLGDVGLGKRTTGARLQILLNAVA